MLTARWLLIAAALVAPAARAAADPWRAQTAAGVEYDSNVRRVENTNDPEAAPVLRSSARVDARGGEPERLRWSLQLTGGAKAILAGPVDDEDVLTGSVDAAVGRRTRERLALGARVTHYEVWPLEDRTTARAFATSSAAATVAIDDDRGRRAALAVGARRLVYKPDPDFDWTGPTLALTLEDPLWRGADDRALDLVLGYRLERRTHQGLAYRNTCAPDEMLTAACIVPGTQARSDLVHVAGARATYTGARILSLDYELIVDDSTSFGSSLVRQRLTLSLTTSLPAGLFATATVTGQLDAYAEPPLIATVDPEKNTLDGESRSSAAVRVARSLGGAWQLEARWSIQRNAFNDDAIDFRRQLAYAGVTWER